MMWYNSYLPDIDSYIFPLSNKIHECVSRVKLIDEFIHHLLYSWFLHNAKAPTDTYLLDKKMRLCIRVYYPK